MGVETLLFILNVNVTTNNTKAAFDCTIIDVKEGQGNLAKVAQIFQFGCAKVRLKKREEMPTVVQLQLHGHSWHLPLAQ